MNKAFNLFFKANDRRIYYQMQRLKIPRDLYDDFYAEGIFALWQAYKKHDQEKGDIGTYINYQIRYRMIDLIRKGTRDQEVVDSAIHENIVQIDDGNRYSQTGLTIISNHGITLENEAFWQEIQNNLTAKQWKWVQYFIIANLSIKEIVEIEHVTVDTVKSWGRQVRRKLRSNEMREKLEELL